MSDTTAPPKATPAPDSSTVSSGLAFARTLTEEGIRWASGRDLEILVARTRWSLARYFSTTQKSTEEWRLGADDCRTRPWPYRCVAKGYEADHRYVERTEEEAWRALAPQITAIAGDSWNFFRHLSQIGHIEVSGSLVTFRPFNRTPEDVFSSNCNDLPTALARAYLLARRAEAIGEGGAA